MVLEAFREAGQVGEPLVGPLDLVKERLCFRGGGQPVAEAFEQVEAQVGFQ